MPMYARGHYAQAVCDRCGQWCRYLELSRELVQYKNIQGQLARSNLRVCNECKDTDTHRRRVRNDAQALRHPRPDVPEDPIPGPGETP